jgi:hypothetical protein
MKPGYHIPGIPSYESWTPASSMRVPFWYDASDPFATRWAGVNLASIANKGSVGGSCDIIALVTQGAINGRTALSFPGNVAQRCRQTVGDTGITGPITILTVRQYAAVGGTQVLYDANNATHRVMSHKEAGTHIGIRRSGTTVLVPHVPEVVPVIQEDVYIVNNSYAPFYESRLVVNGVSSGFLNTFSDNARIIGWNFGINQSNSNQATVLIGECVVFMGERLFDANLRTDEIFACRKYLGSRWNIPLTQDTHRLIVWEGNSLIYGTGLPDPPTQSPPAQLQGLLGAPLAPWYVYGTGNAGNQWPDLDTQYNIQVGSRFRAGATRNVLIVYEDTNSILNYDSATIMAMKSRYCNRARSFGWEVWCSTCCRRAVGLPIYETRRLEVNAATRATWNTFADNLCDFDARPTLSDNTNLLYFQPDQTHLTVLGSGEMADEVFGML